MKYLSWYSSPTGTLMGYGYASLCLIQALQLNGVKVDFLSERAPTHISFIQPEWYQNPNRNQYSVGYTPWESSEIPDSWKYYMDQQNEIWTTSSYCQEIFAKNGIDSLVVPHGIDPEVYPICHRTLNDKFIFYHIGSPTERKGSQLVVDAFIDLFDGDENVQLLLKSNRATNARWTDKNGRWRGNAGNHPQITVVEYDLSVEDMSKLYQNTHCFVYPSNGEGFGLNPFQAIATGMPTILTDATGMTDFSQYGLPLRWTETEGEGLHLGQWAKPDEDHLRELMLHVYKNWDEENKKAIHNANIIHSTMTWKHIADKIINILGDNLETEL